MKPLNMTYYAGQIKKEFRGENALFMEVTPENTLDLKLIPLNSEELGQYTEGMHSPMRAYLGVNLEAKPKLLETFEKGELSSAFGLDHQIIREEIVKRRYQEVCDLESASLQAMIDTGK